MIKAHVRLLPLEMVLSRPSLEPCSVLGICPSLFLYVEVASASQPEVVMRAGGLAVPVDLPGGESGRLANLLRGRRSVFLFTRNGNRSKDSRVGRRYTRSYLAPVNTKLIWPLSRTVVLVPR